MKDKAHNFQYIIYKEYLKDLFTEMLKYNNKKKTQRFFT